MTRRRRRNASHTAIAAVVLTVVVVGVAIAGFLVQRALFAEPKSTVLAGQNVTVVIASGSTTRAIAEQLAEAGVIASSRRFVSSVKDADAGAKLKAGTYELTTGMPDDVVIDALVAGPVTKLIKVTIPEGFTVAEIAARLQRQAGIPAEEFLALAKGGAGEFVPGHAYLAEAYNGSLEGYLFPKTYLIREGSTASDVINMMLDQFDKEIALVDFRAAKRRGSSLNEVVTMASMVEKEAKLPKDRPRVVSVIYNRLRIGMKLQFDSPLEYVLPTRKFRPTNTDLETDSPYNDYKHAGLPPGPICNPGLDALEAAAHPAVTKYLYFVLTSKNGSLTFTTNYADFQRANQKSHQVFGQ